MLCTQDAITLPGFSMLPTSSVFTASASDAVFLPAGSSRAGFHRANAVNTCERQGANAIHKIIRDISEPLAFGTLAHAALQHYYTRHMIRQEGGALDDIARVMHPEDAIRHNAAVEIEALRSGATRLATPVPLAIRMWEESRDRLLAAKFMPAYSAYYALEMEYNEVASVEQEFETTIEDRAHGRAYLYTQRADLVLRDKASGRCTIIDHKTAGRPGAVTHAKYNLSGQRAGYAYLGRRAFGAHYGGTVFSFMSAPNPRYPGAYWVFERPTLPPLPAAEEDFPQTVIAAERKLASIRERNAGQLPTDLRAYTPVLSGGMVCGYCPLSQFCQTGELPRPQDPDLDTLF